MITMITITWLSAKRQNLNSHACGGVSVIQALLISQCLNPVLCFDFCDNVSLIVQRATMTNLCGFEGRTAFARDVRATSAPT